MIRLRILGYKYEQYGEIERAIDVFEKVKKMRPEEPQSFRDLAIATARRGTKDSYEQAITVRCCYLL
jgi:hypothetical protein